MNISALEQFELNVGVISNYQVSLIGVASFILLNAIVSKRMIAENAIIDGIISTISQLVKNQKEMPFLITLFTIIVLINYQGLWGNIYVSTTQGLLSITISVIILTSIVLKALKAKGIRGFGNLFLNDTPMVLFTFIFVIEVFSYSLRALSLGVRLMANLLAGHVLLHTLMSYLKGFITTKLVLPTIGAILGVLAIVLLEQAVWGIQAFVLTLLTATYLNELED